MYLKKTQDSRCTEQAKLFTKMLPFLSGQVSNLNCSGENPIYKQAKADLKSSGNIHVKAI